MDNQLQVFSAGVARKLVEQTIKDWEAIYPEVHVELTVAGSVDLIRKCQSGASCDVLIVADDNILDTMILPDYAKGYIVFAGNRLVITANPGYEINAENWKEKLTAPDATFDHHNPYADPGGYRAVMALMLADNVESGLGDKLMNHPGHFGMGTAPEVLPEIKYSFDYYSRAWARGACIAELPEIMNLSNDALAEEYAKVKFKVDINQTVAATPICHALTIPSNAKHLEAAKKFASLFLKTDFSKHGFMPRYKLVGENILEPVQAEFEKKETPAKEKTPEELALEAGYYASCFRSH